MYLHPAHIGEHFFEKLLLAYGDTFLEGKFPPASFLDFDFSRLGEEIHRAIEQQYPMRFHSICRYWRFGVTVRPVFSRDSTLRTRSRHSDWSRRADPETPAIAAPVTDLLQTNEQLELQVFFDAVTQAGQVWAC